MRRKSSSWGGITPRGGQGVPGMWIPSTPPDLGSYARFWAGDPLWTPPADGGAVDSWRNGGTLGTAATQGTGSAQPIYRASGINGRPAVDFVSNDYLSVAVASLAQPFTIVMVLSQDVAGVGARVLGTAAASADAGIRIALTPNWGHGYNTSQFGGTPVSATPVLLTSVGNGASSKLQVNSTTVSTANPGTSGIDIIRLGTGGTIGTYFDGQIAWADIISGDATTHAQWAQYQRWLFGHYRIAA